MHHIRRTLLIQPGRNQTENEQMKNYERGRVVHSLDDVDVDERSSHHLQLTEALLR